MRIPIERFVEKYQVSDTGCHVWTGVTAGSNARYGYFRPGGTKEKVPAHRWIWEYTNGPLPEGVELDHVKERCTTKLCVNLEHLEPVTHKENRKRGRLSVCRSGKHNLTKDENVRWDSDGNRRGCKLCHQESQQARKDGQ